MGEVVGDGHCVAYVRELTGLPPTSSWCRGARVCGSTIATGTAIATFDPDGTYGNHTDGRSHAAIVIGVHTGGITVVDQWVNHPVARRTIRWRKGNGLPVNDGNAYYMIEVAA